MVSITDVLRCFKQNWTDELSRDAQTSKGGHSTFCLEPALWFWRPWAESRMSRMAFTFF